MTPAARLRDAARVLRERAEAATPGPWVQGEWNYNLPTNQCKVFTRAHVVSDSVCHAAWPSDAAYIALMSPTVALALADWLDEADRWAVWDDLHESDEYCAECSHAYRALAVADAVLGGQG